MALLQNPSPSFHIVVFTIFITFTACVAGTVAAAEERAIYLALMEGPAVAFHRPSTSTPLQRGRRLDPNSEVSKAHAKRLIRSHDQLLQNTLDMGSYNKLYSFKHIVNGFAIHTTPSQAEKLKHAPGVMLVEKDRGVKLMTTYTPQFLHLPQGLWAKAGGPWDAGKGIVIGFVDTGINPTHPSFAYELTCLPMTSASNNSLNSWPFSSTCEVGPLFPARSCNGKIAAARFFAAGAEAAVTLNAAVDFLSPFDAVGHGSHVASIAAGNARIPVTSNGFFYGWASGMAPCARIAVYKAVYPSIGTLADVAAAIDQATMDGVDVLTLSVGPDEPPAEETITYLGVFEILMLFAERAGIFVVQAAGNKGPSPSSVASTSPWAVGVAAGSVDRIYRATLLLGNGKTIGGMGLSGPTFGNGQYKYRLVMAKEAIRANGTSTEIPQYTDECQLPEALDPALVQGTVVICNFSDGFANGISTLGAIFSTARTLGFAGFVLVANPVYGDFEAEPIPFTVPGIMIPSVANAQILLQYYERHTYRDARGSVTRFGGRATIGDGRVAEFTGEAPIVSKFSSRGPAIIRSDRNPVDVLKPDILAPGHQVWAAWSPLSVLDPILTGHSFALISGTSMATPHVAGVAALIKQINPSWTPSMIASAISTTAAQYDNLGKHIMAEGSDTGSLHPASPFDFGAGLLNPTRAIDPGLVITSEFEDYISFLCSLPGTDPGTIQAATGESCYHPFSHPSDLNLPSVTISSLTGSQSVQRTVKNIANNTETYAGSVLPPDGVMVSLHPTWFNIVPNGTQELEIQFNVTQAMEDFSFGWIVLTGSCDHIVRIPLSILPVSVN